MINDKYFLNPAHNELCKSRYYKKDENGLPIEKDIDEVFMREIGHTYKDDPAHIDIALRLRREKKLISAGRIMAQSGTSTTNLLNCFTIGFKDDTREAISELKRKHFNIQAQGGGTGMNFSSLRPAGSMCKSTQSRSSGAIGFITDFSYQSSNISQGGNRSGANLGALYDWHPDLFDFITKKSRSNWENIRKFSSVHDEDAFSYFQWAQPYPWQMFNVSVFLSDEFMESVEAGGKDKWVLSWKDTPWHLWKFNATIGPHTRKQYVKEIIVTAPNEDMARYKAKSEIPYFNNNGLELIGESYDMTTGEWFRLICHNSWEDGCPGVVYIGTARRYHNGEYFNQISSCNPCSEQFLPVNSVCCLASLILPTFFVNGKFDFDEFRIAIHEAVRGLDNVISLTKTGEADIDANSLNERRIGLGTTGIAELLIMKGFKYSSQEGRDYTAFILEFLRNESYLASIELSKERGSFPAFEYDGLSQSEFFKTLPFDIQKLIEKHGIRNVTILTQAPVGTTGTMVGFSTGCEPYFAMCFQRNSRVGTFSDGSPAFIKWLTENNINYADHNFNLPELKEYIHVPDYFEEAHNVTWQDHVKMQAVFAKYVCSAVSKTVNLPNDALVEDVEQAYLMAYQMGIKSTTVYRDGSKQQILEHIKDKSVSDRPSDIIPTKSPKRPKELDCDVHHTSVKGEKWTVLVGLLNEKPYEIFVAPQKAFEISSKYKKGKIVKNGKGSYHFETEDFKLKNISSHLQNDEHRVITRLISTSLRHGIPMSFISEQLTKADGTVVDMSKAILRVLKKYVNIDAGEAKNLVCGQCGSSNVVLQGGCPECLDCGISKCG